MRELHVALISGPQYDRLAQLLPAFERRHGYRVSVEVQLPHVELNARMAADLGSPHRPYDLISTHTKYAPSQAAHLRPLDELMAAEDLADFFPGVMELCRINGTLLQLPRNFDARLLFYRADLIAAPQSWEDAAAQMARHARPGFFGFAFPGRHSGLFGTFYELLGMAGGDLFDAHLRPIFNDAAGIWALRLLHRLHTLDRVTPPDLLERWYYDEVSEEFRRGHVLMIGDWPGFYGLYKDPQTCAVIEQFDVAVYPAGPTGVRKSYAGCHSFAIPKAAPDVQGALLLLRYLISPEVQYVEASRSGHTPVRRTVFDRVKGELPEGSRDARRMTALERTIEHYAMIPPRFARYPMVEDILWSGVQQAITGAVTPQTALQAMERQVEEVLR